MTTHDDGTRVDQLYRRLTVPLARRISTWRGVTPNRVSFAAFVMGGVVAPGAVALRRPRWAGAAFLVSDVLDYLDGDVARAQQRMTSSGDVLDGVLDRYTDALIVTAMTLSASGVLPPGPTRRAGAATTQAVGMAALVGCLLPSYIKALAVANGRVTTQSAAGRGTRNRVVWLGLFIDEPFATTAVLAALANLASVHRAAFTISSRGEATP